MRKLSIAVSVLGILSVSAASALADDDKATLEELQQQVRQLTVRVKALEAHHTFTSFMPNFAERFHVMHRAGDAGDWAIASHELEEMKRLTRLSSSVDADKGALMQSMMGGAFESLEHAIEHGNRKKFQSALSQATEACNACHVATGSGFVEVTLEAGESLSLRHPHKFKQQAVPGGHTH